MSYSDEKPREIEHRNHDGGELVREYVDSLLELHKLQAALLNRLSKEVL